MDIPPTIAADFKSYQERITTSLINVTRASSQLANLDLGFHRSSSDKFSQSLDSQNVHLLRLTNKLLKAATKDTNVTPPSLQDQDSIEDNWRRVVDVVDDLLEKADASLDEFNGVIKRLSPTRQNEVVTPPAKGKFSFQPANNVWSKASMLKPQLLFDRKVNNYETGPWKPLLQRKPNAIVPLEESIGSGKNGYNHPYAYEIQHAKYSENMYQKSLPVPYSPPEHSKATFVDTEEAVAEMLKELKLAKEIAIDLEHNDKNSYIGLVSLMQISTRKRDWIIDTLKPWRENLQILNEVFTDPNILKVLHGSSSDIIWLQRDLGLYIVNLFDTFYASSALNFPAKSLAYLLERFANFHAQKQYQLADWRIRPLPQELLDYARSDTHFLLYISDILRNMLIDNSTVENNLVDFVAQNSKKEALQTYERPVYDRENGLGTIGWMKLLLQRPVKTFTNEQFGVFRTLHEWRDQKARELDEGEQIILPNGQLWTFAESMPTKRMQLFGGYGGRTGRVPQYIAQHHEEFLELVTRGKEEGMNGPSVQEIMDRNADKLGVFRHVKKFREKPQELNRSVAETMQRLQQSGALLEPKFPDIDARSAGEPIAVRSERSCLWGAVPTITNYSTTNEIASVAALRALQPFDSFVGTPNGNKLSQVPAEIMPVAKQQDPVAVDLSQNNEKNNIFVLRGENRKRKAGDTIEDGELSEDEVNAALPETPVTSTTADRFSKISEKAARKAAKKTKKEAEKAERDAAQANIIPFDYASAESMLKPSKTAETVQKKAKKPMNPFAKGLEASTGARRNKMGKELAGKSQTFKS